jgi:hypothetical protein
MLGFIRWYSAMKRWFPFTSQRRLAALYANATARSDAADRVMIGTAESDPEARGAGIFDMPSRS